MRRPYPNRRRKRKGRPPPHRYKAGAFPIRPNSFQDLGLKAIYDLCLPTLGVHNRRRFFNQVGGSIVLGTGVIGAAMGFAMAGPVGGIIGGGAGLALGDHSLRKHRCIR
jgi:hypothetical protein